MKIDEITRQSLLYDFYGALLTKRQKEVMELYHEENLSLAEIADDFGISRQGVYDALRKAEYSLESYEKKLGLVARFAKTTEVISDIDSMIDKLIEEHSVNDAQSDTATVEELKRIKEVIDRLEA